MENILEWLVPVIFAAIYFFGNMLSKKSDDDAPPPSRSSDKDADAIERQRRIQAEIRRKIMERRRGELASPRPEPVEGMEPTRDRGSPYPHASESARDRSSPELHRQPQPSASHQSRHPVERRREIHEQQKETRDRGSPYPQAPESARDPVSQIPHPEPPDNPYETEFQAKLQQIEATKRQAEKLKQQAAAVSSRSSFDSRSPLSTPRSSLARGSVRATLRDPAAARTAFIHSEIIGPPISQRKTQTIPGLS